MNGFLFETGMMSRIWRRMGATASQEKLSPPRFGLAALLIANALLALGPMLVRLADVGPVSSAFWRMAIALPLIVLLAAVVSTRSPEPVGPQATAGQRRLTRTVLRQAQDYRISGLLILIIAASGLLFAADLASWHLGIVRTKVANATLFGNSASLIFPIYGFVVARAWPGRMQVAALLLAAIGAGLLMGRSAELSPEHLLGDLLSLLAGVFYAAYFIAIARARETLEPLPLLAASTLASAAPLLILANVLGERIMPTDWTPLIALALCSQVAGQGLMVYALGRMSPLIIGLTLLTQPVVAALTGWLVFRETLAPLDFVGAGLVALALVLVRQPVKKP